MRTEGVVEEERGGEKRRIMLGVKGKRSREWGREGGEGRRKREGEEKGVKGYKWRERKGRCEEAGEEKGYGNGRRGEEKRR